MQSGRVKLPKMSSEKHRERIFKLLWIMNINTKMRENHYRVLFQDIKTGMYLLENIFPEQLLYYSIGSYYKDSSKLHRIDPEGEEMKIRVDSAENNIVVPVSEVLADSEYDLRHSFDGIDFTREIKKQYCVVFERKDATVIVPCAVIGPSFYFLSTSMRQYIFSSTLEKMYEKIYRDPDDGIITIHLKPGTADRDVPHIIRFFGNGFAKTRWSSVKNNLYQEQNYLKRRGEKHYSVPLKIDFPVKQLLTLGVRAKKLSVPDGVGQKIIVFDILREDSGFDFNEYRQVRKVPDGGLLVENTRIIPQTLRRPGNTLINKAPDPRGAWAYIRSETGEKNVNIEAMRYIKEYEPKDEGDATNAVIPQTEKADLSLVVPGGAGDGSVIHARLVRERRSSARCDRGDAFTFDDFLDMAGKLRRYYGVSGFEVEGPFDMPLKEKKDGGRRSLKECYDGNPGDRRKFIVAAFSYGSARACLVEVDRDGLPGGASTYVLVSDVGGIVPGALVRHMLDQYVKNKRMGSIENDLRKRGLGFILKKHPAAKNEEFYNLWCRGLLRRLDEWISV